MTMITMEIALVAIAAGAAFELGRHIMRRLLALFPSERPWLP